MSETQLDMQAIWEYLKAQGFAITMLVVLSYVFWGQINKVNQKLDECNDQKVEILLNALNDNTRAINKFTNTFNIAQDGKEETTKALSSKSKN